MWAYDSPAQLQCVGSYPLGVRYRPLDDVCVYGLNSVLSLHGVPDSIVLREDFNNGSETWRGVIGRNSLPDLNSSGVLLLTSLLVIAC